MLWGLKRLEGCRRHVAWCVGAVNLVSCVGSLWVFYCGSVPYLVRMRAYMLTCDNMCVCVIHIKACVTVYGSLDLRKENGV